MKQPCEPWRRRGQDGGSDPRRQTGESRRIILGRRMMHDATDPFRHFIKRKSARSARAVFFLNGK